MPLKGKGYIRILIIILVWVWVSTWEHKDKDQEAKTKYVDVAKIEEVLVNRKVDKLTAKIAKHIEKTDYPGDPLTLAKKIRQTKHPKTLTAILTVESNGKPAAIGKVGEKGLYQVRPEIHGPVSSDPLAQTDQAARILEDLVAENDGDLRKAIQRYNGSGKKSRKYASQVSAISGRI